MRRAVIAFALGLCFLAAFVVFVGPARLSARLAETNVAVFAVGLVAVGASLVCWSEGLRPLLANSGADVSRWRLLVAYTAAMLGRQVLPLGAVGGPAVTAYTVEREVDLGYDETLAIVAVAEFLSTVASLTMAGVGVAFLLTEIAAVQRLRFLVYGAGGFAVALLVLGVVFLVRRDAVRKAVQAGAWLGRTTVGRVSERAAAVLARERMGTALGRFYDTVDDLGGNRWTVTYVTALHFVGWVLAAVPLYTSALALDASVSIALALLLVPTAGLVDILPMPGGLGGVEIFLGALIAAVGGMELALAAGVVLLYRICSYWFLIVLGGVASAYSAADVVGVDPEPDHHD